MKILSTRIHGTLDYTIGVLLLISPWLFQFGGDGISTWLPVSLGVAIILYSAFTDYEYGMRPEISMRGHLGLDALAGFILAISPWLFNFESFVYLPHLILGIVLVVLSISTHTVPSMIRKRRPAA